MTVDAVVFTHDGGRLKVLLIKRKHEPFAGRWALPGGFVGIEEEAERAVARELLEETGLGGLKFEELGVFDEPGRDPRGRIVSVVFLAMIRRIKQPRGGSDAAEARWVAAYRPPPLAFAHRIILVRARARLRDEALHGLRVFDFLPVEFTLEELQAAYEAILGRKVRGLSKSFLVEKLLRRAKGRGKRGLVYRLRSDAAELLKSHQSLLSRA